MVEIYIFLYYYKVLNLQLFASPHRVPGCYQKQQITIIEKLAISLTILKERWTVISRILPLELLFCPGNAEISGSYNVTILL